jgi:hypothetical protein
MRLQTQRSSPSNSEGVPAKSLSAEFLLLATRLGASRRRGAPFPRSFAQFTVRNWMKSQPFRRVDDLNHFAEGYLKAGLPE